MKTKKFAVIVVTAIAVYSGFFIYAYLNGSWPVTKDREYRFEFIPPVLYQGELVIRNDSMGQGLFGVSRSRGTRTHAGVDLYAPVGTIVKAAERGVGETGNYPGGYGLIVRIDHNNGYVTVYAHLSEILIEDGQFVKKGAVIGKVGKTGNADHDLIEPHLHFEIRKDGIAVDPMEYLLMESQRGMETAVFE